LVDRLSDSDVAGLLSAVAELAKHRSGALVSRFVRLALERIRQRWDSRGQAIAIWSLALYYDTSARLEPLTAGPDLRATWEATHPGADLTNAADDDMLDSAQLTRLQTWLRLVQIIRDNEPRLLRQVRFPHSNEELVAKILMLAVNELDVDWSLSGIDEYSGEAQFCADMAEVLGGLADYFPTHHQALTDTSRKAHARLEYYEEQVRELEAEAEERARDEFSDEPDDPAEDAAQPFSILALMRDL
jgi:hypothetical protein